MFTFTVERSYRVIAANVVSALLEDENIQRRESPSPSEPEMKYVRLEIPGKAYIEYETNGSSFWILDIRTEKAFRRQGLAALLMQKVYEEAAAVKGAVIHGTFTEKGAWMKPMIKRLASKSRVRTTMDF
jgi:GNAT superfamily N-acetyltransferase